MSRALLQIKDLTLDFAQGHHALRALDRVSFSVSEGEALCLVGESGSGKTVTALSIARLLPSPPARYSSGQILLDGEDVLRMNHSQLRAIRGRKISYVFQEPGVSMNPVQTLGSQIRESLRRHDPASATDAEVARLLRRVGISSPETRVGNYPHEISGGMQQRAMIAMALASHPKLLIADEPTTALDATIQAQIIELLRDLKRDLGMAILLITHNLGIVNDFADRVAVMYAGQIVETSRGRDLLRHPLHPYTRALVDSVPQLGASTRRLAAIPGTMPRIGDASSGCRFHPRCALRVPECETEPPVLQEPLTGRSVRCPFWISPPSRRSQVPGDTT